MRGPIGIRYAAMGLSDVPFFPGRAGSSGIRDELWAAGVRLAPLDEVLGVRAA
ncbi:MULTISPECIES: hypothetical protein [Streptomyces]|uniref:hypothetical protein n=1 Tax=Streptomyces lycopersici TaxID=2974589 RepID=UPI0021CEFAEB|nr:hypothetical protein [Streptomyces sp. NEAU-383]